ncbi:MAG: M3 family metallopeptidase [Bdellovibrionota bacterium]
MNPPEVWHPVTEHNPLLEPAFRIPFGRIRPEHVEPAVHELIARARREMEKIGGGTAPRTFENTLGALDELTRPLDFALTVAGHLESVATTPELRAAWNAVQAPASQFYAGILLSEGLWKAIRAYAGSWDAARLSGERHRFLEKTLLDFRREGADLPPEGKARLQALESEMAELATKFSQNVLDSTNAFELLVDSDSKLAGLPESARAAAKESAKSKGKEGWRFTLQAPSFLAAMTYLDDAGIREKLYRTYNTRAAGDSRDNREVILKILSLRKEKAKLLGFKDFAEFATSDRMVKSGERAAAFVESLRKRSERAFQKENEELADFRKSNGGAGEMKPWDVAYWAEKQRAALYGFDEEQLRPYFPLDRVIQGLFTIAQKLYGIRILPADLPTWHESVQTYEVRDEDGKHLGSFYSDMFPRESKRDGAWMNGILTGRWLPGRGREPHLGLICGNLNPPVNGRPALLTHRDVETLFHEFGHLLHHLFSQVRTRSLSGTSVPLDFVELPSQIMENWTWEREALDLFAGHFETGAPVPDNLFAAMKRARNFRSANAMMRQLGFATLDLSLHRDYGPEKDGDVIPYCRKVMQPFAATPLPEDYAMVCSFHHLFSGSLGYAAGYYSYKWAEVLDADAFGLFKERGVLGRGTGLAFRKKILERGNGTDPLELFKDFRGREPDPEALLVRSGLA